MNNREMLGDFTSELEQKLSSFRNVRPFVCEGNPLECEVFILGINPATEMEKDFWSFWSINHGFEKSKWMELYILERSQKPLRSNRKKRNTLSSTRQRIEWISESLKPIKALETNLFIKPTEKANELQNKDKATLIFEFLLDSIKPKLILAHGKEVKKHLERHYKLELIENQINHVKMVGFITQIIPIKHLSRGWSKQKTLDLGKCIKDILKHP